MWSCTSEISCRLPMVLAGMRCYAPANGRGTDRLREYIRYATHASAMAAPYGASGGTCGAGGDCDDSDADGDFRHRRRDAGAAKAGLLADAGFACSGIGCLTHLVVAERVPRGLVARIALSGIATGPGAFALIYGFSGLALGYWPSGEALWRLAGNVMAITVVISGVFQYAYRMTGPKEGGLRLFSIVCLSRGGGAGVGPCRGSLCAHPHGGG